MEMIIRMQILLFAMAAAGAVGVIGILASNLSYKRMLKNEGRFTGQKDKWLLLWQKRDQYIHRMNRFVWYPSLASTLLFAGTLVLKYVTKSRAALSPYYLYLAAGVPVVLLLLRTAMDISFREGETLDWMREYLDKSYAPLTSSVTEPAVPVKKEMTKMEKKVQERERKALEEQREKEREMQERERMLDHIAEGIRQTAATGGRFSKMLTPEETAIMKEIIQEFMNG